MTIPRKEKYPSIVGTQQNPVSDPKPREDTNRVEEELKERQRREEARKKVKPEEKKKEKQPEQ